MPSSRRDEPDGHIPVYWLDTKLKPTRWEQWSRRWINLPAALLIALIALAVVVPAPSISVPTPSIPSISIPAPAMTNDDPDPEPTKEPEQVAMDFATPRPVLASLIDHDVAVGSSGATLPELTMRATHPANELGNVPILMYHAFVQNPENTDEWTVTFDQFRGQLDWLREHDFVMVGMQSMVDGRFDVPAGKKPVILTFDDASAGQFGLRVAEGGGYEVKPDTAVGILEEYRVQYPEFAGPAFFAVLPFNCFASEDDPSTCEERLAWLVEHNYEIGNHTYGHDELTDVTPEYFTQSIGSMKLWINERVPQGKGNLSEVLVLPFGAYPDVNLHADQLSWLAGGFWYLGDPVNLDLVIAVTGGPAVSPYSVNFTTVEVFRYNTEPGVFSYWAERIERQEVSLFVSDGDPETVTVPAVLADAVNRDKLVDKGLELSVYGDSE